jgi:hypothetical protein
MIRSANKIFAGKFKGSYHLGDWKRIIILSRNFEILGRNAPFWIQNWFRMWTNGELL